MTDRVIDTDGGYHGYWAKDLYAVNSKYGTADDLKSLVKSAHDKVSKISLPMLFFCDRLGLSW